MNKRKLEERIDKLAGVRESVRYGTDVRCHVGDLVTICWLDDTRTTYTIESVDGLIVFREREEDES